MRAIPQQRLDACIRLRGHLARDESPIHRQEINLFLSISAKDLSEIYSLTIRGNHATARFAFRTAEQYRHGRKILDEISDRDNFPSKDEERKEGRKTALSGRRKKGGGSIDRRTNGSRTASVRRDDINGGSSALAACMSYGVCSRHRRNEPVGVF